MCGCSSTTNGKCKNCNSPYFHGYDNPQSILLLLQNAPNSDGLNCTINTQYVDVNMFFFLIMN